MSQQNKVSKPKIRPTSERIKEITLILMNPENKIRVAKRLKKFQLYEKVAYIYIWAEDWPDPENQRYQPRQVAAIVAWAESGMKIHTDALDNKKKTKEILKNEFRSLGKKIEKIERTTKQRFNDLPSEVRMSSFFENKEMIGPYNEACVKNEVAEIKKYRLIPGKTRPKQKPFDTFCLDMKQLFTERTGSTPNFQLIADIANLFKLTSGTQTSDTIRQRLHKLSK